MVKGKKEEKKKTIWERIEIIEKAMKYECGKESDCKSNRNGTEKDNQKRENDFSYQSGFKSHSSVKMERSETMLKFKVNSSLMLCDLVWSYLK